MSSGAAAWTITPSLITATRSDMLSASVWSWVTNKVVTPTLCWRRRSSNLDGLPQTGVEVGQWLVEEEQPRPRDQRPRERHPLLLPTGQLCAAPAGDVEQLDRIQRFIGTTSDLRWPGRLRRSTLRGKRNVVENAHVRPDAIVLEDHADVTTVRGDEQSGFD